MQEKIECITIIGKNLSETICVYSHVQGHAKMHLHIPAQKYTQMHNAYSVCQRDYNLSIFFGCRT